MIKYRIPDVTSFLTTDAPLVSGSFAFTRLSLSVCARVWLVGHVNRWSRAAFWVSEHCESNVYPLGKYTQLGVSTQEGVSVNCERRLDHDTFGVARFYYCYYYYFILLLPPFSSQWSIDDTAAKKKKNLYIWRLKVQNTFSCEKLNFCFTISAECLHLVVLMQFTQS